MQLMPCLDRGAVREPLFRLFLVSALTIALPNSIPLHGPVGADAVNS